jgi:signal transduction histidine kinase
MPQFARHGRPNARRLAVWLLLTTVVPATALAGLGWALVREDRARETERRRDAREHAATLAATALQRTLAELEDQLSSISVGQPSAPGTPRDDLAIVTFEPDGTSARAGLPLPFYPEPHVGLASRVAALDRADLLEFRQQDRAGAIAALRPLTASADPSTRGEALLRLGRLERKQGHFTAALDAFERLTALDQAIVNGEPAGLLGAQARALALEEIGRHEEVKRVAATLVDDLDRGRWLLSRTQYAFAREQAGRWLGPRTVAATTSPDHDPATLATAAEMLWTAWRRGDDSVTSTRSRSTLWTNERSVLAITRRNDDRLTAMLVSTRVLERRWRDDLPETGTPPIDLALTDADGRTAVGRPRGGPDRQSVRTASVTNLPWTVHAIDAGAVPTGSLSRQARLMLAALVVMMLAVAAGGYVTTRSLVREMHVSRLQSDFVSAVSHEFRTPLTAVRHLSQLLARGRVSSDERRAEFYDLLVRESDRLHRLVESLLNFARLEAGQLDYRFETVDPAPYLRDLLEDFRREVVGRDVRLEVSGDEAALPTIRADREVLGRVFWNLLDNAVKYSPDEPEVRVELEPRAGELLVRVRDRGMGIPAAEQSQIFQKFVRGAAARAASIKGTGIGLAMAREIVRAHGGDIIVDSTEGSGSTFTVSLPVASTETTPS